MDFPLTETIHSLLDLSSYVHLAELGKKHDLLVQRATTLGLICCKWDVGSSNHLERKESFFNQCRCSQNDSLSIIKVKDF